jgi:hypothetical protein
VSIGFTERRSRVTAASLAEAGNELHSGDIDNEIRTWSLRTKKESYVLTNHIDTVISLVLSLDSQTLLPTGTVAQYVCEMFDHTFDAGSRAIFRVLDSLTMHSPRRTKRLETLREAEREKGWNRTARYMMF